MQSGIIDVHAHFIPDFYRAALIDAGHTQPDGMPAIPAWDEADTLAAMDRLGIRTALLSISSPGVHFGDDTAAAGLARRVNEEAARLAAKHPGRFGFFATLPLPDITASLAEASYALETLHADGVVLETNHHGVYLGDSLLEPLYALLNSRQAKIFIHPTSPHCTCAHGLPYPRPMMEFLFETTRSVTNMLLAGVPDRHPDLHIIVPHGGASLSVLADRISLMTPMLGLPPTPPGHFLAQLKSLYYDLAGAPLPRQLPALLTIADPEKLLYGSDAAFTPWPAIEFLLGQLRATPLLTHAQRETMFCPRLFPRFCE